VFSLLVACAGAAEPLEGDLRVGLVGQGVSGQIYRLRDGVFTVDGASGTVDLSTESLDPDAAALTADFEEGDYTVTLLDGWRVERQNANDTFSSVDASLLSPAAANVAIVALATTPVTYTFEIRSEGAVPFDAGTLEIDVDFDDQNAACDDDNSDGFCDVCGDGIVTTGEACDGSDLAGETCVSLGFDSGTLICSSTCGYDTSGCSTCGDGVVGFRETCEPPGSFISIEACLPGCFRETTCSETCQTVTGFCECF
jgi:hypothetical protein